MSNRLNNHPNDSRIKVLHVIGGMNRAGAESMIMNIYRCIDRTKIQFDFLVYSNEKQDFETEIKTLGGKVIHTNLFSTKSPFTMVRTIRQVLREHGPYQVIHCATLFNSAYALLAALPFKHILKITHSHNTQNTVASSLIIKIYERFAKYVIQHYTEVPLACGKEAGEFLFGKKLFSNRGIVLLNSVDIDQFTNVPVEKSNFIMEELGLHGQKVVTSIARLDPVKNHTFMIDIASVLKSSGADFKMLLVGKGELHEEIKSKIKENNLNCNVIMLGTRSDIAEILSITDVFLMPSIFEGNPVSLIEAQIAGCRCVISDSITEKIDIGLNLIERCSLDDNSAEDWANIIKQSCKSQIDYNTKKMTLIKSGYDLEATTKLLSDIYEKRVRK